MKYTLAVFCLLATAQSVAQNVVRSGPPFLESSAGGFTILQPLSPVVIDGQQWFPAQPNLGGEQVVNSSTGQFTIRLSRTRIANMGRTDAGLAETLPFSVQFSEPGRDPVPLVPLGSYALLVGNRWIFSDPLDVVDVRTWRRFDLSKQFGIESPVKPWAVSADGTRVIFTHKGCTTLCTNTPDQYFEISLPPAPDTPKYDPIGELVARLAATHGFWSNGTFTAIELPANAPVASVLEAALEKNRYDNRHVSTHRIIETREVQIDELRPQEHYTAVLIETDLGNKIVLLRAVQIGWWSRIYDE